MDYVHIHNANLLDGTGADPKPNGNLIIADDLIYGVGALDTVTIPATHTDIERVDAMGGYVLPGMIDTHVHLMFEVGTLEERLSTPFSLNFYKSVQFMQRTLDAGVTTVRDAGGTDLGTKRAVEQGVVPGPRMQISISVLGITGGHTDNWFPSGMDASWQAYPGNPGGICDGVDGVRKKVREVLRAGADIIKICSTGGVLSPTDHPEFTQFSPDELDVIVQEARFRRNTKVMAHAQGLEGIKNAVRAGVHSIEHGIYLDDEVIEMMIERGTFLVPTLLAPISVIEIGEATGNIPEYGLRKAREVYEAHHASIARAHRAGVKIAMGTDAGVMPHGQNLRELELMTRIGMTPMEAIVASTQTAAECLGWQDAVGTLEKGKYADVIISKVNPLEDIAALADPDNITFVMQGGKVIKDTRVPV